MAESVRSIFSGDSKDPDAFLADTLSRLEVSHGISIKAVRLKREGGDSTVVYEGDYFRGKTGAT
jgi:hypothetical protein